MTRSVRWSPLFPLDLVLYPGERVPLRIFEPRYHAMTTRCEDEGIPFGLIHEDDEGRAEVGCFARIEGTLARNADGSRDIVIAGEERFRLLEVRVHTDEYDEGRVRRFRDQVEPPDPEARARLRRVFEECRKQAQELQPLPEVEFDDPPLEQLALGYTFELAAQAGLSLSDRQRLLELDRESEREQFLLGHVSRLLLHLERKVLETQRVRKNGKTQP